jgi:predicted MFS family arabinose efflux permease
VAIPWLRTRLSANNFLTWGALAAWQGVLADDLARLGFRPLEITLSCASAVGANLLSTLAVGQLADRRFAAQKLMGVASLLTAAFLAAASRAAQFATLGPLLFLAAICFVPTFPLAAAVAFRHLPDPARQWPACRAWGTVGWMGCLLLLWGLRWLFGGGPGDGLLLAAVLAVANGISSFTLPDTPPAGSRGPGGLALALGLFRDRPFAVLTACLFGFHLFGFFFYPYAALFLVDLKVQRENLPLALSLCQVAEIVVVFALPRVYSRLGPKGTIAVGLFAWGLRYALFVLGGPLFLVLLLLPLHGPGFGFTRIAATIHVDRSAPPGARASVQSLVTMLWEGLAPLFGAVLAGVALDRFTRDGTRAWGPLWGLPAAGTGLVLLAFLAFFRLPRRYDSSSGPSASGGPGGAGET